ncbi:MAG: phospho-N-acetylmuramoyl-pentapeptide-transferase [Patiriisocius sp.]|jgi:phospho-N-acetylmuramoyl-pentapeptide-transferase
MDISIIKILIPAVLAFIIGIAITPLVTHYLYKYKVWKKEGGKTAMNGTVATEFNRLKGEGETKTPRMGGIVIWGSVLLTVLLLAVLGEVFTTSIFAELDFFSRSQTWIPISTMVLGAALGFLNDFYDVTHRRDGVSLKMRLLLISMLAGSIGWWFYAKLGVDTVGIPFDGTLFVGWLIIPIFIVLANALYASGVIDGIDGLSGGVFASIFIAYSGVAVIQSQFDIAALCTTIAGGILAFLWFNIPPARFWMTETGSMALTLTLAVIVFMTDSLGDGNGIALLFVIGLPLVATVLSNIVQVLYRKATGKKLLRIAPLHHHFEAIGWPSYKVTMRYWIISIFCAIFGIILAAIA